MGVTLVFLGRLADRAGADERLLELTGPCGWAGVLDQLEPDLAQTLADERVQLALNGELLADKYALVARDGDELAFLPPVSGG